MRYFAASKRIILTELKKVCGNQVCITEPEAWIVLFRGLLVSRHLTQQGRGSLRFYIGFILLMKQTQNQSWSIRSLYWISVCCWFLCEMCSDRFNGELTVIFRIMLFVLYSQRFLFHLGFKDVTKIFDNRPEISRMIWDCFQNFITNLRGGVAQQITLRPLGQSS